MKRVRHIKFIRVFCILFLLSGAYTAQLSHTAEVVIGQVCWYTLDTLLKLWTSGLATDFCYRMQEFKKRDALLCECIAYLETQHATNDPHCDSPYTETEAVYVETTVNAFPLVNDSEFSTTLTGITTPLPYTTDLIINGTNAAEQFLKPGERFDPDIGTCTTYYHDNYGNLGLKTEAGNSNVRMVTNAASIFNFIKAVGDWLCKADDDTQNQEKQYYVPYKNTPEQKEAVHQYCLRRLKQKLITQIPTWSDAYLNRRVEILEGWRVGQEKALKKYNSYLAIAETIERIQHFAEAKHSAEQYIESFDAELEAIRAEQAARLQKQNASKNVPTAYTQNTPDPDGKDPKDKDKKECEKKSHANGLYKGAKYHHTQSNGVKSPGPKNGQLVLDSSLEIAHTTPRRIGIEEDYFVIFDQTHAAIANSPAEFHGHIRTWEELTDAMQALLRKKGLVNAKGKILL